MSAHRDDIDAARLMDPGAPPPHAYQSRARTRGPPLLLTLALLPLPPNPLQWDVLTSLELQPRGQLQHGERGGHEVSGGSTTQEYPSVD